MKISTTLIERAEEAGCKTAGEMALWMNGYEAGMIDTQDQAMKVIQNTELDFLKSEWTPKRVTQHTNRKD